MRHRHLLGTGGRLLSELLVVAGLLLGGGVAGAGADATGAPLLHAVEATSETTLHVIWESRSTGEHGFSIEVRRGGALMRPLHEAPPLAGRGSVVSATITDLQPGTRYCVRVRAILAAAVTAGDRADASEEQCVTTLPPRR